jgi:8-oxo-dGTP pyrophosphatase MutT (NUDIX family)
MSTDNPWTTTGSKVVYENSWIRVREDQVIAPGGRETIYGVVETRIATGVLAMNEAQEIYLVGQFRYPMNEYSWEIIEGGADLNEEPLAAAKRELAEEAGLVAAHWEPLGSEVHVSNCISSERGYLYLARGLTEVPASPEDTEILQIKKVPLSDALAMVDSGEIKDSLSIIALLRAARALG